MFRLKPLVWYYIYIDIDKADIFISDEPPVRSDKDKCWYHPELKYKCILKPFIRQDPKVSANIQEFVQL